MLKYAQISDVRVNGQRIHRSSDQLQRPSFEIKVVLKQGLSFEAQSSLKYICHVTNSRIILEARKRSPDVEAAQYLKVLNFLLNGVNLTKTLDTPLTILHSQIQSVEVVSSTSKPYVRMLLKTMTQNPTISATHEIIFEVCSSTLRRSSTQGNWTEAFVSCIKPKK